MGSMNSNNWLSFPLSPSQAAAQSHHFSVGLVNDSLDTSFQNPGNIIHYIPSILIPLFILFAFYTGICIFRDETNYRISVGCFQILRLNHICFLFFDVQSGV